MQATDSLALAQETNQTINRIQISVDATRQCFTVQMQQAESFRASSETAQQEAEEAATVS